MRRLISMLAAGALLTGLLAGPALAFDSPGRPDGTGPTFLTWTGQGTTDGTLDTPTCPSPDVVPAGISPTSYLLWIFTTDGGEIVTEPVLTLGGTGSGTYYAAQNSGGSYHFFTPYVTPDSSLSARVDFTVSDPGNGAWILTISHGCPGGTTHGAELGIDKTASGSYDTTYVWKIVKQVDKTLVKQVGGSATFTYAVAASHDSGTDSNWAVAGTIKVTNPNAFEVTGVDVTDEVDNGGSCAVTGGGMDVSIPAEGSLDLEYTCSYASAPTSMAGVNTATVQWPGTSSGDVTLSAGSARVEKPFSFAQNLVDECVEVSDSFGGVLGTVCVDGANPTSFTYARTIPVPTWDCTSYGNTATLTTNDTGTQASDDQTVTVCGPMKTGALTMGFWQNKNGQAIITGQARTGPCPSAAWLQQYAPFKDLLGTATCAEVGSYVTKVIKAASAAGPSMNAMLKAQMLATALDVYFSDPALGGNKIGAPTPIGGVSVDLTMVCTDLSCTAYENSSSVFGGTPRTVSWMLASAASQSDSGGGSWYGNVKATQELAKDAFDAINNQKAFAP